MTHFQEVKGIMHNRILQGKGYPLSDHSIILTAWCISSHPENDSSSPEEKSSSASREDRESCKIITNGHITPTIIYTFDIHRKNPQTHWEWTSSHPLDISNVVRFLFRKVVLDARPPYLESLSGSSLIKFEKPAPPVAPCRIADVCTRDHKDHHDDDARLEGESSAKRQRMFDHRTYSVGEFSSSQAIDESNSYGSGTQEQLDEFDAWMDDFGIDDDEVPSEEVSPELLEEISGEGDEAQLIKEDLSLHIPKKPAPMYQSCERDLKAPPMTAKSRPILFEARHKALDLGSQGVYRSLFLLLLHREEYMSTDDMVKIGGFWGMLCDYILILLMYLVNAAMFTLVLLRMAVNTARYMYLVMLVIISAAAYWNGYLRKGRKTKPKRQNRTRNGKAGKRQSQILLLKFIFHIVLIGGYLRIVEGLDCRKWIFGFGDDLLSTSGEAFAYDEGWYRRLCLFLSSSNREDCWWRIMEDFGHRDLKDEDLLKKIKITEDIS
ncbi:hypothetical protein Tco_0293899 [Tanacetum coccineum]